MKAGTTRVRALALAAILLVAVPAVRAATATGLAFLRNGVDARAVAMGQAVTAIVADASACYWNPAGLQHMERPQILLMHEESFAGLRHEYAAITQPLKGVVAGLAFNGIWTDDLDGYDEIGESTGPFGYSAYATALALGFRGPWGSRLGVGGKYLNETIGGYSATGWAADLGCQWSPSPSSPFQLGLAVRHLGPAMKFIEKEFNIPLTIQGGVGWRHDFDRLESALTVVAELRNVRDQGTGLLAGVEYMYHDALSLGVGYLGGDDSRDVSAGMGVRLDRLAVHYAYVPVSQEDIGDGEHRVSLRIDL
jgi:hypothetical protein